MKLYKIAYIELYYHQGDLEAFMVTMLNSQFQITFVVTQSIYLQFQSHPLKNNFNWIEVKEKDFSDVKKIIETSLFDFNLILIATLAHNSKAFLDIKLKNNLAIRIHNAHKFLFPQKVKLILYNYNYFFKQISYFIFEFLLNKDLFYINKMIEKANSIIIIDEGVLEYIKEKKSKYLNKINSVIPHITAPLYTTYLPNTEYFTVAVTGTVDGRKRNYFDVINAIKILKSKIITNRFRFVFLGKPFGSTGDKIIDYLNSLKNENIDIITFKDFVPFNVFDSYIKETHVLLSPIVKQPIYQLWGEIYGKTKICSGITDMVRFGLISIFPNHYYLNQNQFNNLCPQYKNPNELADILINLSENIGILKHQTNLLRKDVLQPFYGKDIIIQKYKNLF